VFFAGIPLGLVSIGLALLFLEGRPAVDEQQRSGRGSFDWLGSGLSAATLAIFLLAMVTENANEQIAMLNAAQHKPRSGARLVDGKPDTAR